MASSMIDHVTGWLEVVLISGCLFKIIFAIFMKEKRAEQNKMFKKEILLLP
jgi:hypothetical protein